MSAVRKQAILSKVLTRLYPGKVSGVKETNGQSENGIWLKGTGEKHSNVVEASTPSSTGSDISRNLGQNEGNRSVDTEMNLKHSITAGLRAAHNIKKECAHQKIYTVSLPPENYVPDIKNDGVSSATETSELDEDVEDDHSSKRRKRRRRRKGADVTRSYSDSSHNLKQTKQPLKCEGVSNRNQRKKFQRRRQKERLKAAGLWPKTKSIDLTNQPNKGSMINDTMGESSEPTLKEQKTMEDLLDFLQATQEMYFTGGKLASADSGPSIELVLEIMNQIKNGVLPFSEICLLHQFKSLLFLKDIEKLKESLGNFKEHSSLPLDHKMALHSLFYYWITDILPIKEKSTT